MSSGKPMAWSRLAAMRAAKASPQQVSTGRRWAKTGRCGSMPLLYASWRRLRSTVSRSASSHRTLPGTWRKMRIQLSKVGGVIL